MEDLIKITKQILDDRYPDANRARNCTARWQITISAQTVCGRRSTNPFLADSARRTPNFIRGSAKASINYSPAAKAIK
jgi:hypothetical protein